MTFKRSSSPAKLMTILAIGSAVALTACGAVNKNLSSNPQVTKGETAAQQIVQSCVAHGNLLTHNGRQAVLKCMAPPGQEAAFQTCASGALAKDGVLTSSQRQRLYGDLAVCVEKHR